MSVPVPEGVALDEPGLLDLAGRFHDQHLAERGFCFRSQQPLMRGVRVIARGTTPKPDHLAETGTVVDASRAQRGTRPAYWGAGFVDTPVFDGSRLGVIDDAQHFDQLVELLRDLLKHEVIPADHDRHARHGGIVRDADGQRFDIVSAPRKQSRHPC